MPPFEPIQQEEIGIETPTASGACADDQSDAVTACESVMKEHEDLRSLQKQVYDDLLEELAFQRQAYKELEEKHKRMGEELKAWKLREKLSHSFFEEETDQKHQKLSDMSDFNAILVDRLKKSYKQRDKALKTVETMEQDKIETDFKLAKLIDERDQLAKDAAKYRKQRNDVRYELTCVEDDKRSLRRKLKRATKQRNEAECQLNALRNAITNCDASQARALTRGKVPTEIVLRNDVSVATSTRQTVA